MLDAATAQNDMMLDMLQAALLDVGINLVGEGAAFSFHLTYSAGSTRCPYMPSPSPSPAGLLARRIRKIAWCAASHTKATPLRHAARLQISDSELSVSMLLVRPSLAVKVDAHRLPGGISPSLHLKPGRELIRGFL